jgi:hypothetical protein
MGVAVGTRLYTTEGILGSVDDTLDWLQSVFAKANLVYTPQLNFVLTISDVYIPAVSGETESWDDCTLGMDSQLSEFSKWGQRSRQGLWHLFDNCYDMWGGAIGLAYVGSPSAGICAMDPRCYSVGSGSCVNSYSNTGVSWYSSSTWKTFAHEIGHNFGADHAFDNGQGTTGGIMDYGDGTLNGIYQFNTEFTKDDICTVVSDRVDEGCDAITTYAAVCGDGLLADGEECECDVGTSCAFCEGCLLTQGKQCTPEGGESECCTSTGLFEPSSTLCTMPGGGGTGFCQLGTCKGTWCTGGYSFVEDFCGLHDDNECKVKCIMDGECDTLSGWSWQGGGPLNDRSDGGSCNDGAGTCISGECVLITPSPTPAPSPSPTPAPSPAPAPVDARVTISGCICQQSWSYEGATCVDYCCNPDSDPRGEWCFTVGDCGTNRESCAADSRATPPTPSGPTAAPTPGGPQGGGEEATTTASSPSDTESPTPAPTSSSPQGGKEDSTTTASPPSDHATGTDAPEGGPGDSETGSETDALQVSCSAHLGASALLAIAAGVVAAVCW